LPMKQFNIQHDCSVSVPPTCNCLACKLWGGIFFAPCAFFCGTCYSCFTGHEHHCILKQMDGWARCFIHTYIKMHRASS
jgi:hypothetical protein